MLNSPFLHHGGKFRGQIAILAVPEAYLPGKSVFLTSQRQTARALLHYERHRSKLHVQYCIMNVTEANCTCNTAP